MLNDDHKSSQDNHTGFPHKKNYNKPTSGQLLGVDALEVGQGKELDGHVIPHADSTKVRPLLVLERRYVDAGHLVFQDARTFGMD